MASRFIELIESGRIADEAALKRAFRAAAKRVHPDARVESGEAAARAFIALRADYEAALAFLGSREAGGAPSDPGVAPGTAGGAGLAGARRGAGKVVPFVFFRGDFYQCLEDLIGRGFPRRPRAAFPRAGYDAARSRFLSYVAGRDLAHPEDRAMEAFLAFEAGYAALARPGSGWLSVENDSARSLYFILSDIVLYHENGFAHLAAFARNMRPVTEAILRERGETRPLAFLAILVADLDAGPACLV